MQSSSPRIENFSKFQLECNITDALEIPLYSDSRWSSAFRMLDTAYRLRKVCVPMPSDCPLTVTGF